MHEAQLQDADTKYVLLSIIGFTVKKKKPKKPQR